MTGPGPIRGAGSAQPSDVEEIDVAVGIFAGIPVRDFRSALSWYERLLGGEPTFYPNDVEAVWQLAEDRYVYIVEAPERAGGAVGMIWVDDPVSEVAKIGERGVEPVEVEKHDSVWKFVFRDADGNETGIGGEVVQQGAAGGLGERSARRVR